MGYSEALEAAGAEVLEFQEFGSYRGDWFAKVNFGSRVYWTHGSYGSCSGCDEFEAEFDYGEDECSDHKWGTGTDETRASCKACAEAREEHKRKLAEFGKGYLVGGEMTQSEVEEYVSRNLEWDSDAPEMLEFVKAHAIREPAQ